MKDRFIIFLSILICIIPIMGIGAYFFIKENKKVEISTITLQEELNKQIKKNESITKALIKEHTEEVVSHTQEEHLKEQMAKYQDSAEALKYMFASAFDKDPSLFIDGFLPETIMDDLSISNDSVDRIELVNQIKSKITRNNTLEKITINDISKGKVKDRYYITLIYEDGEVNTSIELTFSNVDLHGDMQIYLVSTSSWRIIKDIEKELKG